MGVVSGLVLFAVIWFLVLFVILPIRLETQGDRGEIVPGTMLGSPAEINMRRKAWITTLVSAVIWVIVAAIILSGVISVEDLDWFNRMGPPAGETGG
ncbi:MAG: DUF1467 family protein [Rhodobacteraceae bacterium]|nr:DUF1467 family protein [Paracoccaceae bacterium]